MNKEEIYAWLTEQDVTYEVTEHQAVFNMEELKAVPLPYPEWDAKNLFVRDGRQETQLLSPHRKRGEEGRLEDFPQGKRTARLVLCLG